jgi:tetratricopeptide (TPR) repeat protein
MKANNERRAGQLPAAKASLERALQIDPKVQGATMLLAQLSADLGAVDDAVKAVKADVAADPSNKERNAQFLLGLGNTAYREANAATGAAKEAGFKKALTLLQASEEINPSPNAKFLTAVSAFSLLQASATRLQASKSCADARASSEYLTQVNTNMPGGGSVSPDAAKQIMGAVGQYQAFVDASMKRYCK